MLRLAGANPDGQQQGAAPQGDSDDEDAMDATEETGTQSANPGNVPNQSGNTVVQQPMTPTPGATSAASQAGSPRGRKRAEPEKSFSSRPETSEQPTDPDVTSSG